MQKTQGKNKKLTPKPARQGFGESNLRGRYCETETLGPTTPQHDTARGQNAFANCGKRGN